MSDYYKNKDAEGKSKQKNLSAQDTPLNNRLNLKERWFWNASTFRKKQ
ncbi:hypothetical protein P7H15_00015 [Paenibacillus larvae]|nr:hypothetical protein [Paenibacillus larvae]MDT2291630.1 hypothetical protein [Paenibacillus larvae]